MLNNRTFWNNIKEGFINLVYPLICENCERRIRESSGYAICNDCMEKIKYIKYPYCYQCGKPMSSMVSFEEKAICADCYNNKKNFYYVRSIAYYSGVMRKCIHLLKYKKQVKLVKPLGDIMVRYLQESSDIKIKEIDLIIPVPLSRSDYIARGFNQSSLLAGHVAEYYSKPFSEDLLIKNKDNDSQVGLSRNEREKNVKNVYKINNNFTMYPESVLLIDDNYTTGSTIYECCMQLRKLDLKKIFVLTLARGV